MNYNLINNNNINLLKKFIKNETSDTFRYYKNRKIDIIKNHILTLVLTNKNDNIIGYAHLDFEEKIWLGICVCENYRGKGFGKKIINYLLEYAKNNNIKKIHLTVDKDNIIAKKLYEKNGFIIESEKETFFYMVKLLNKN
jgi:ribosomal protein S18 acetylase RimI-like enzyme